jgi:type I restriction enzyme, R subunit
VKEATARIKINKLLEDAGWRFFDNEKGHANIQLEPNVSLKESDINVFGEDFENASTGFVDFLLLNDRKFPLIVLEAKSEDKNPLVGKEQARKYAKSLACRFIILSNGNLHYFWDLERGNPYIITSFPTQESVGKFNETIPNTRTLIDEVVKTDYVVLTQRAGYASEAGWKIESERKQFIESNGLRFLRPYQLKAIHNLQQAVAEGRDRFLFEMATGTGKTLVSAAIIKLFLRTRNARRVLFLVDRLELEDQAEKAFKKVLSNDYKTVIYKETKDEWNKAEVVVTTVQSLLFNNKYKQVFSPTDFDLVISDEAHRSIGGNSRAVFDYFIGYKLGLTATPKDYLKKYIKEESTKRDPREYEKRMLLDTYRTFGCEDSEPTFRYSLLDGVRDGFLINPIVVDARTGITTELISDSGYTVEIQDELGNESEETFKHKEFEKKFFSDATNQLFCKVFLENGLRDPISKEFGKSIAFAVSQDHAARLTQIFNEMADKIYPGKYQSDFAVQVTSQIDGAQDYTRNFSNNNLLGSGNFIAAYRTSKARICVTVGMMTTGYDCPDILNLGLFRPIFSPTDFIQIKGRGTRKHDFIEQLTDESLRGEVDKTIKVSYKLIDFFANCDYFEHDFDYDDKIDLPKVGGGKKNEDETDNPPPVRDGVYYHTGDDIISTLKEETVGVQGMKIDRMLFAFEEFARENDFIKTCVEEGKWDQAINYLNKEVFDKPTEYFNLEKLRKSSGVDRRIGVREILEKIFGLIPKFKSKDELLEEEFSKFIADYKLEEVDSIPALKAYFKAYVTNDHIRHVIATGELTDLATSAVFSTKDYKAVPEKYRKLIPEYVKDYVSLNQFVA